MTAVDPHPAVSTQLIVDVDVHCAPRSLRDLEPYLNPYWMEYARGAEIDLSPSFVGAYPPAAATSATTEARAAGTFPPDRVDALRAQLLDRRDDGVSILTCTTPFATNRNPYYEAAIASAVNDWIRTEWLDRDDRLRGSLTIPTLDTDAAVKEIDRLGGDKRFVQVLLPVRGLDNRLGHVRFRKALAAAARHDLVVGLHAWGRIGSSPTPTGFTHTYLEDYLTNSQVVAQAQLVSLITEGVFDVIPDLRVALLECGFSWIPALMWRFDKDWKGVWREVPWMLHKPSDYLYRHFRVSTQPAHLPHDPEHVRQALEMVRAPELLMFASDYPHDHGDGGERLLAALREEERSAVLAGNARDLYRI